MGIAGEKLRKDTANSGKLFWKIRENQNIKLYKAPGTKSIAYRVTFSKIKNLNWIEIQSPFSQKVQVGTL